jgi:hypothetical protein
MEDLSTGREGRDSRAVSNTLYQRAETRSKTNVLKINKLLDSDLFSPFSHPPCDAVAMVHLNP